MRKVFRFLGIGTLAVAFTGIGAATGSAQETQPDVCKDETGQAAVYGEFTKNYAATTIPMAKTAISSAKQYVEKYGACTDLKEVVDYLKNYIPPAEKILAEMEHKEKMAEIYKRFNDGMRAKNWDAVYAAGKDVIANERDQTVVLDVTIVLGTIGFDEATANKNEKYIADTLKYANEALKKMEAGQSSKAYGVVVGNTKYAFGEKDKAMAWLTYQVGYLTYNFGSKDRKAAVPYLFKATQFNSEVKNQPASYLGIGSYYLDEVLRLNKEREEKLDAAKNVETEETKAIFALQKGYAERAMEAYAKAYNMTKDKAAKDDAYTKIKFLYEVRNGKADGLTPALVATFANKPLTNPTTEVKPIVEAPPAETTTPDGGAAGTAAATTKPATTAPATKPAAGTTKPAATPAATTPAKTSGATATTKTPAKKTAPKKKGTR